MARDYIRQERTLRSITWAEALKLAQAREISVNVDPKPASYAVADPAAQYNRPQNRRSDRSRDRSRARDGKFRNFSKYGQNYNQNQNGNWGQNSDRSGSYNRDFNSQSQTGNSSQRFTKFRGRSPAPHRNSVPHSWTGPSVNPAPSGPRQPPGQPGANLAGILEQMVAANHQGDVNARRQVSLQVKAGGLVLDNCIADTGSSRTIISRQVFDRLDPATPLEPWPCEERLYGVGGGELHPLGIVPLEIYIAHHRLFHPVIVSDGSLYDLILGTDSMRPHKVEIKLDDTDFLRVVEDDCDTCRQLSESYGLQCESVNPASERFFPSDTPLSDEGCGWVHNPVAKATIEFLAPPRCAIMVDCTVPGEWEPETEFYAEGTTTLTDEFFLGCVPTVVRTDQRGQVKLAIVNPTSQVQRIHGGTTIAKLVPISAEPTVSEGVFPISDRLPKERKLEKILTELQLEELDIPSSLRTKLKQLVERYIDAFAEHDSDVGRTDLAFHEIIVGDSPPLRQPVRRIPYGMHREEVDNQVRDLLESGVIRPSTSPWASPIVMVRKKDGGLRMGVESRRLNAVTKIDAFPI